MPQVLAGKGTKLQMKLSGSYVDIAQVTEVEAPGSSVEVRDTTDLSMPMRAFRPAVVDPGKLTGKLFYDPSDANHAIMINRVRTPASALDEFKLVYVSDGLTTHAEIEFKGFFTKFHPTGIVVEGNIEADFEIQSTDTLTHDVGTP